LGKNQYFDSNKPTVLLNSHHDTVKPNDSWTENPFIATEKAGKIIGLGSNDAGASLVCLIAAFCHFYAECDLPFNLILAATAEEEISGKGGIESLLHSVDFPAIAWAIVGEPTDCQVAIAEKGSWSSMPPVPEKPVMPLEMKELMPSISPWPTSKNKCAFVCSHI